MYTGVRHLTLHSGVFLSLSTTKKVPADCTQALSGLAGMGCCFGANAERIAKPRDGPFPKSTAFMVIWSQAFIVSAAAAAAAGGGPLPFDN